MSIVKITESILEDIADAIREGKEYDSSVTIKPVNFASEISTMISNKQYPVNITQSNHQTIYVDEVLSTNTNITESFVITPSSSIPTIKVHIVPDEGYNKGTLNGNIQENTNIVLTETALNISASAATIKTFTITINNSNPAQLITVTCNNVSHTTNFTCNYGDTITCSIALVDTTNYSSPGTLNIISKVVKNEETIYATDPQINEDILNLNIAQIDQRANSIGNDSQLLNEVDLYNLSFTRTNLTRTNWSSIRGACSYSNATNVDTFNPLLFKDLNNTNLELTSIGINYTNSINIGGINLNRLNGNYTDGKYSIINNTISYDDITLTINELIACEFNYINSNESTGNLYYYHDSHQLVQGNYDTRTPVIVFGGSRGSCNFNESFFNGYEFNILSAIKNHTTYNGGYIIPRCIFSFRYTNNATGKTYVYGLDDDISIQNSIKTYRTYQNYNTMNQGYIDTGLYDIELFGFRMYHVEDNEYFDDFAGKLSQFFISRRVDPEYANDLDIAKIYYRIILQKEVCDKMYAYIASNSTNPDYPLAGQSLPFKLIFR